MRVIARKRHLGQLPYYEDPFGYYEGGYYGSTPIVTPQTPTNVATGIFGPGGEWLLYSGLVFLGFIIGRLKFFR